MSVQNVMFIAAAAVFAFLVAFAFTPISRKISIKMGAIDVPKDDRRMHSEPIPTMGGLAIFIAFAFSVLAFVPLDKTYMAMLLGALMVVLVGMLDDIFGLKWWVKLIGQIGAALIVALNGIQITSIRTLELGGWAVPFTVLWIVGITNAINLIDGLDGLACGIVAISCVSLLFVASLYMEPQYFSVMIIIAALAGACFGFLPYNMNPAKIFMGDTGAMFIGFAFSVISIQGFFKLNALVSFGVPFLVLGLPILDTLLAFFRRVIKGQSFFKPDKKHLHHRLIDWGFNQKQSVVLMYSLSGVLGVAAFLFAKREYWAALILIIAALAVGLIVINRQARQNAQAAGEEAAKTPALEAADEKKNEEKTV